MMILKVHSRLLFHFAQATRLFLTLFLIGVAWLSFIGHGFSAELHQPAFESPERLFNQALEQEKKGDSLAALIDLKRALILNPRLKPADKELATLLDQMGLEHYSSWRDHYRRYFSSTLLFIVGLIGGWLGICFFFFLLFSTNVSLKRTLQLRAMPLLASLLLFAVGHIVAYVGLECDPRWYQRDSYILLPSSENQKQEVTSVDLLDTPADEAEVVDQVRVGSLLKLGSKRGNWSYVILESGKGGWIPSAHLEKLIPKH